LESLQFGTIITLREKKRIDLKTYREGDYLKGENEKRGKTLKGLYT